MSDQPTIEPLRFLPFRREDILRSLYESLPLPPGESPQFERVLAQIEQHFREDFASVRRDLKSLYAPLDPDRDTRVLPGELPPEPPEELANVLERVLDRANYDKVSDDKLAKALKSSSLFQVRLVVDLEDFEEVLLYTRGASEREETLKEFFGLWKRRVRFVNYDRVVLFIRLKDEVDNEATLGECPGGSTLLKLFQNVPASDLEMLFPNIRIGMRLLDKLMIGVPAVVSGFIVVSTKAGTTLLLLASLFGFWLGLSSEPVELDKAAMLAVGASLFALGGYLWKQLSNYRNRKLKYTQALTQNLYFKLLDNNAGVIFRVLDDAEESEVKESFLAYYFLLLMEGEATAAALDDKIQAWFSQQLGSTVDFDVEDALQKLAGLQLAKAEGERWMLVPNPTI